MKTIEIVLCENCKGKGVVYNDQLVDYHKREYVTHVTTCHHCNGSGRMEKTTEVTYEPYSTPTTGVRSY